MGGGAVPPAFASGTFVGYRLVLVFRRFQALIRMTQPPMASYTLTLSIVSPPFVPYRYYYMVYHSQKQA